MVPWIYSRYVRAVWGKASWLVHAWTFLDWNIRLSPSFVPYLAYRKPMLARICSWKKHVQMQKKILENKNYGKEHGRNFSINIPIQHSGGKTRYTEQCENFEIRVQCWKIINLCNFEVRPKLRHPCHFGNYNFTWL